ncbi:MAG TPA: Hsp20/alpha crystallin family protein [Yinghuangia sp.]|uniref:Hsp20/alpha crystallin family protein n=1 Tax=Yinghuangia sp. YIM S10712 TaxID=3436930 RepID=UPI002B6E11CD|nr:Hsp20/alpha crystallin family protein [Yinghuangia sp.]
MAGELMQKRPHWWPSVADWFEGLPFDMRFPSGEHVIAVEEFREDGVFVVKAEVPGVDPDKDIEITVSGGVLTVHAERLEEETAKERSEFRYGSFTRSLRLPEETRADDITATYDNGVLTVKVPLGQAQPPTQRIRVTHGDQAAAGQT